MIKVDGMNDGESDAIKRLQEEQTFVRPSFRPPLSSGVNRNLCPFNQMLNLIQMCQKKGKKGPYLVLFVILFIIINFIRPPLTSGLLCLGINCHWWIPMSSIWHLIWVIMQVNGE